MAKPNQRNALEYAIRYLRERKRFAWGSIASDKADSDACELAARFLEREIKRRAVINTANSMKVSRAIVRAAINT